VAPSDLLEQRRALPERSDSDVAKVVGAIMTVVICGIAALIVLVTRSPKAEQVTVQVPMQDAVAVQQQAPPQTAPTKPTPVAAAVAPMGDWTARIGVEIARRGLAWVGWPYSFAGGGTEGPSYGVAVDKDSRLDGKVRGFDCSGLAMYALAPWRSLAHFAATQYDEVGTFHPALNQLQPGDLIFWSPDPSIAHIGHVAIYVGDGQVVQAPHSGALITVSPLYGVEGGYMGATRPLT